MAGQTRGVGPSADAGQVDVLILMEDYQDSFTRAYQADPTLPGLPYAACAKRLFSRPIYYGDAYIDALTHKGLLVDQIVPLCRPLQFKWANERNMWNPDRWMARLSGDGYPVRLARRFLDPWFRSRIVKKQIASRKPSIVWVFSGVPVTPHEVRVWRRHADSVILWWSCPLREWFPYSEFDLVLTAVPAFIDYFETLGVRATYLPHSFDSRIIDRVSPKESRIPRAAFVGSLSPVHTSRMSLLDKLSRRVGLDFFGHGVEFLPPDSPLRHSYCGPAWGEDLYSVYASYLVVVHKSADLWRDFTSAKRLFEATGMGACVVTEATDDLSRFFEPDEEIVTYSSEDECIEKVERLLSHPEEARRIGQRSQARTLKDHTYRHTAATLLRQLESLPRSRRWGS